MSGLGNPLLQQFIPETRELLEQAGRGLLALERDPLATAPMNELFRAMHTLKGTSGLFEIGPFTQLVHAGEDLRGAAQAGRLRLTPDLADLLLDTMDQLGLWVDALARSGTLPAEAEALAETRAAGLRAPLGRQAAATGGTPGQPAAPPSWLGTLSPPDRAALPRDSALVALRYTPDEHCFFRGEDPLGFVRQLPGLVLLRLAPSAPWPPLGELDAFRSALSYLAVAEAPQTIVEALADPLVHMVRNSLDHGIEPPAERIAAGKPETGTLRPSAVAENDHVVIRVADDGRGLDPARLRARAAEKGLLDAERAAALSDEEACHLIFLPGFSTAAAISDLSGRGVGMGVVRSTIERAGGRLTLSSRKGEGTIFEIILPLSMAVTRLMTIACGERLFGVPMGLVAETVRIPRDRLHRVGDREAFVLRDRIVPVQRLARLLHLPEADATPPEEEAILVVRVNGERLGLVVGAFREVMGAIVRPLEGVLAGLAGFGGTTLLGDGRVLRVLDLPELTR